MGIDMELMRRKLATLRGEGTKDSNSPWFKPDEGDTDIRIVPTNDGDPLKEMFFHYTTMRRVRSLQRVSLYAPAISHQSW